MSSRRVVYPYTLCGKLALFPFKFYYNNNLLFKSCIWATVCCLPFFYKMQTLMCSEANYIKYAQYKKKEEDEYRHHAEHLD